MRGDCKTIPKHIHPGEGRGPIGKVDVTKDGALLATFPNWAPAFAGVVLRGRKSTTSPTALFSREGGSPVWAPAFAGEQA